LPCRCIGAVRIDQKGNGGRVENPRVILRPDWQGTQALETERGLTDQMRAEIEQFFLNATLFTEKDARIAGWLDDAAAETLIREASV
jgi:inorganic pyrophosphatase